MRLVSATVRHFRKIKGPVTISFTKGLNLLHGQNEIGKSTFVEAIWAALTMPAKGNTEHHRAIQPRSGETPEVQLTFVEGEDTLTVEKTFGSTGRCRLRRDRTNGASETWTDQDAEQHLRTLMGVGKPKRGEVATEDTGRWRVLWVRQGQSCDGPGTFVPPEACTELNKFLAAETDVVIAGDDAMAVLTMVGEQRDLYFTAQGKERSGAESPLARARLAVEDAGRELTRLQLQQQTLEKDLVELTEVEGKGTKAAADLEMALRELNAAKERADGVAEAQRAVQEAEQKPVLARSNLELHEARKKEREGLIGKLEVRARNLSDAKEALGLLGPQTQGTDEHGQGLRAAHDAATTLLQELQTKTNSADVRRDAAGAARDHFEASTALHAMQTRIDEIAKVQGELRAEACDETRLKQVTELDRALQLAAASLRDTGVTVRVQAHAPLKLEIEGEAKDLSAGQALEHELLDRTTFAMEAATFEVVPGGAGIADARRTFERAEQALQKALQSVGATSFADVETRAAARRILALKLQKLQHEQQVLPSDRATLQKRQEEALEELARARQLLPQEEVDGLTAAPPEPAAITTLRELARGLAKQLEAQRKTAQEAASALSDWERSQQELKTQHQRASDAVVTAEREWNAQQVSLAEHVLAHGDDATLTTGLDAARKKFAEAEKHHADAKAALDALDPEDVARRMNAAERRVALMRTNVQGHQERRHELRGKIEVYVVGGGSELDAQLELAEAQLKRAEAELARTLLDAQAYSLLHDTMQLHKSAAESRLRAPLVQKVNALLQVLLPNAELSFADDSFQNIQLKRPESVDPTFHELSAGAREQVGIILRLAMALVMRGQGELVVVLDDALVSSDETRLRAMFDVLDRAAEHLQILMVTCHADRMLALGFAPHNVVDFDRTF